MTLCHVVIGGLASVHPCRVGTNPIIEGSHAVVGRREVGVAADDAP
jgi:hypothetical protein